MAQKHAESYTNLSESHMNPVHPINLIRSDKNNLENVITEPELNVSAVNSTQKCYFCGLNRHSRELCPAKNVSCHKCGKLGHFSKVCRSHIQIKPTINRAKHVSSSQLSSLSAAAPASLTKSIIKVELNGEEINALVDTGSSESFIGKNVAQVRRLKEFPIDVNVSMASTSFQSKIKSYCQVNLKIFDNVHSNVKLLVLDRLCTDIIIGHDILKTYESLEILFGGNKKPLKICSLSAACIQPVKIFSNLSPNCTPISTKSRRHSLEDSKFIEVEIQKLLSEGIIETSVSPWRAQVLVVKNENHKKRMVVDYSQTINRFTMLDAYPLPRIDEIVNEVSKYKFFSTIDLQSAYYQLPIAEEEKQYTAFEACGGLYQFCRVPFGVTNGVAVFQRVMDMIIKQENLKNTFAYLDDITICGETQEAHDDNLENFMRAAKKYDLTLNKNKCVFSTQTIRLLGYVISDHKIQPDPERLRPLMDLPIPGNAAALRRAMGMFAHYSNFIPKFSEKIRPLVESKQFPMSNESVNAFELLKRDVSLALKMPVENDIPFTVETDASEKTIAASLSQNGRPVAFFSRTLSKSEQMHPIIEKEAQAIVESLRKWRHYLIGRPFTLITDQKSVSFMFDNRVSGKIKNEKIQRWRLELSSFKYDIVYRPGEENVVPDTLSRVTSALGGTFNLEEIHHSLCHPGVTRMYHWVRSKNIACTLEEIRKMTAACSVCAELKPRFCNYEGKLIKATTPFERLNIDFKGPLPSTSRNRYILTIVDEFSRFPFAFPCAEMTSSVVIRNLKQLFALFGMPSYIHSDRGTSFLSRDVTSFLHSYGIATSRTTPYNPQGNGQTERYNGIIWKTITLALKSQNLPVSRWESVLQEALHSIRSLLCTATNSTPHERMFKHNRKSGKGCSMPTWLTAPGPVLLKNFERTSKYDPLVRPVELIDANPGYARIRLPDGRETTVNVRHLAPAADEYPAVDLERPQNTGEHGPEVPVGDLSDLPAETSSSNDVDFESRPQRNRRPPNYLQDYVVK